MQHRCCDALRVGIARQSCDTKMSARDIVAANIGSACGFPFSLRALLTISDKAEATDMPVYDLASARNRRRVGRMTP
jgi:hypothetical protein